jgi:L-serine dehydratase
MIVSIFNDVVGPVMRGASSSHCAAALRIGRLARDLMEGNVSKVLLEFDRGGSLPTTHESQGSDMGFFGGLMGWEADDERLPESARIIREMGVEVEFRVVDVNDPHPNTYRLTLWNDSESHTLRAISTGGGMIEVEAIDEIPLKIGGDYFETLVWLDESQPETGMLAERLSAESVEIHKNLFQIRSRFRLDDSAVTQAVSPCRIFSIKHLSPVLPVMSSGALSVPFNTCDEMLAFEGGKNRSLCDMAVEYEMARGAMSSQEVHQKMLAIAQILRRSIASGVAGTSYEDRILGAQAPGYQRSLTAGGLLDVGLLNRIILYVSALMEVKSSMGVIVAAPTAGACAAFPASVIGACEELGLGEDEMANALLAGGLVGVFIASQWTFAAEVGGCQAEGGSAAAMAAGALCYLKGGDLRQCVSAASMAMQNMIGLICDPVGRRVEVPCLGKNMMAAANAVTCVNMSLAGFDAVIPLDEVIHTARRVSDQMPRELRCTGLGGLAITKTALAIEKRLEANRLTVVQ